MRDNYGNFDTQLGKQSVKNQKFNQVNWLYLALFNDSQIREHPT